jgi:hypothetical protein
MKKIFFAFLIFLCSGLCLQAQNIRLNLYGNYVFDDHVDSYYSTTNYFNGTIQGGLLWGAGLEFRLQQHYGIELMYMRQDTHAPTEYWDQQEDEVRHSNLKLGINWIMLGGARSFRANEHVEPYGGLMLGMCIVDAENPDKNSSASTTKFGWGFRLGTNIWVNEAIGIKLQAQLLSATQAAGGGLYFGTGGAGAGVTTYSTMYQFVLGGGLTFKFGGHSGGNK